MAQLVFLWQKGLIDCTANYGSKKLVFWGNKEITCVFQSVKLLI